MKKDNEEGKNVPCAPCVCIPGDVVDFLEEDTDPDENRLAHPPPAIAYPSVPSFYRVEYDGKNQ